MLSFLYVYSDHSILECYNLFSGVELSMRSFFVIIGMDKGFGSDFLQFQGINQAFRVTGLSYCTLRNACKEENMTITR